MSDSERVSDTEPVRDTEPVSDTERGLPEETATAASSGAMLPPHLDAQTGSLPADLDAGDVEGVMPDAPFGGESVDDIDPEEGAP
ncbi:hypothetical protein [Pseudolysinimonas sp.]